MAELFKENRYYNDKCGCHYRDRRGDIISNIQDCPCSKTYGSSTPSTSSGRERVARRRRPSANRMRFRNFYGDNSNGYKLFTQQYFIGLLVGAAVGFYVLPKVLKK